MSHRRWRAPIAALLSFIATPAFAEPLHLALADVLGEPVALGAPAQERPAIVFVMSRQSKDASTAFARAVDERLLDAPVESVGIVDVHRYGGWLLRGAVLRALRKAAEEGRARRRERRVASGVDATPASVNRWHLLADFDGALLRRFAVAPDPAACLAFVVDTAGVPHGPYGDVGGVLAAVTRALHP